MNSQEHVTTTDDIATEGADPVFGRIVCAVDGSRHSHDAVEQAIALAAPGGELAFICVRDERGTGPTHQATIGRRAEVAIAEAVEAAGHEGIEATGRVLAGYDPGAVLVDQAAAADLLVVPINVESRASGIMVSSPSSTAVHKAAVPVLVARRPPEGAVFPAHLLVATDGSEDSGRALSIAAAIARRHGARVDLLRVEPGPDGAAQDLDAAELFGVEANVIHEVGNPVDRIVEAADREGATLILVGSRGVSGLRALGSVSERVVHRAHCSVLVARHP